MRLAEYLRIPYIIAVSSEEAGDGQWLRVAECPELPGCRVESPSILAALDALSRRRVEVVLDLLRRGETPPTPREPLQSIDVTGELRELGLLADLEPALELDEKDLPGWPLKGSPDG